MSEKEKTTPVVRFAPSPTGFLHIGSARTALFNYLYAKKMGGKYILRIEDTDRARSTKEYEEDILNSLKWLGLEHDEIYRQSERREIYSKYLHQLVMKNLAYVSKESEGDNKTVIRLRNNGQIVIFKDTIRGEISFDTSELKDFVIAKNFDEALYHFAVAVDDFEMGVTNIIRGEDHLSNTPRQILIQEALGMSRPQYTHLPLILNKDKSKMSKRFGATAVKEYRETGYLPEAIINFLAFLGFSAQNKTNEEIFSLSELAGLFNLERLQNGGAIFSVEKLDWMNGQHIRKKETKILARELIYFLPEELKNLAGENENLWLRIVEGEKERLKKLGDIVEPAEIYLQTPVTNSLILILLKNGSKESTRKHLMEIIKRLEKLPDNSFLLEDIKKVVWPYAEEHGKGEVLWPMRVALTGKEKSSDPFTVASIIQKTETLKRLKDALNAVA